MGKEQEVMLGICGGVGPAAGLLLHQAILQHTANEGNDAGHFSVCHLSRSGHVTDRTEFLSQQTPEMDLPDAQRLDNPALGMAQTFEMMRQAVGNHKMRLVVGVPCNTFHASAIWTEFRRLTKADQRDDVILVHMLEETIRLICDVAPQCQRVGLLSTTGTRQSRVYHELLDHAGLEVIEVNECDQQELHDTIYNGNWGIKSTAPMIQPKCVSNFHRFAQMLQQKGAQVIILGCTEIPFAFLGQDQVFGVPLVDPMIALARAMIREADVHRLLPLQNKSLEHEQKHDAL